MRVVELFETIASIPHCSGDTAALHKFIIDFAKSCGFNIQTDRAGNILCYRSKRDVCLQAHYDMVCVGDAPKIEIVEEDGWLRAKNSTLGADNGIGVAMMLALMEEGKEAEYLFTNDEEVGLVGALHLELELQADEMINLDSEEFGVIYVGCAGGADIEATKQIAYSDEMLPYYYAVEAKNFEGGHSGVDIDKNIPSSIVEFAHFIGAGKIGALEAGERHNSIPTGLKAKVATKKPLESNDHFEVKEIEPFSVIQEPLGRMVCAYVHGVRGWQREFDIPLKSANLARIVVKDRECVIQTSVRANSDEELERIVAQERCFFESFGYETRVSGRYPAWKPRVTPLAKRVRKLFEPLVAEPRIRAIHAGLECAAFAQKFPDMDIVSIGPDILHPHSIHERVRIDQIAPLYNLVKELL